MYEVFASFLLLLLFNLLPVVLEAAELNSLRADDKVIRKNNLKGKAGKKRSGSEKQAKQVFLEAELHCLKGLSSILDHGELDDNGGHNDHQEQFVIKEVLENIVFVVLQLTGIDLVKHLKQHKDIEEDGVVLSSLIVPVTHTD